MKSNRWLARNLSGRLKLQFLEKMPTMELR